MARCGLPRLLALHGRGQAAWQPDQPHGQRWRTAEMDRGGQVPPAATWSTTTWVQWAATTLSVPTAVSPASCQTDACGRALPWVSSGSAM